MNKNKSRFWNEGFQAGQVLNSECPYPAGSPWAKDWLQGWGAGIHKRGQWPGMGEGRPAGRWSGWFLKLLGR